MIEMVTVLMIIGIISAISIPSFLAMNSRAKLKTGLNDISNILQEAQRTATRTSKSCLVIFPTSGTVSPTMNSGCLMAGSLTLKDLQIRSNITSIAFNYRGDTSTSTSTKGTIILSLDGINDQKCLVISPGIGLIRTGIYEPSDRTGTDSNKCSPY